MKLFRLCFAARRIVGLWVVALVLGVSLSAVDQRSPSVSAAPGDGQVRPNPPTRMIIEGHRLSVAIGLTTCADAQSEVCQVGAFDLTMNYDSAKLQWIEDGRVATGATSTSVSYTGAGWKVNQWVGSELFIIGGGGFGQRRIVASNTADTIVVTTPFNPPPASQPAAGSIFKVGGMTNGGWLSSTGRTPQCLTPEYGTGSAQLQCVTLGSEIPGPTGFGNLTNLTVHAIGRGLTSVTLTNVVVLEIDGDPIPVDVFNGTRRVILCPDPNSSNSVNAIDLSLIAQQFGKTTGQTGYTVTRDPDENGVISSIDLSLTAQVFNQKCVQD